MKKLLIALVSMMATVAFANDPAPATTPAPTGDAPKAEMPKDAVHGGAAHAEKKEEKKAEKTEKKAKKTKKAKTETK